MLMLLIALLIATPSRAPLPAHIEAPRIIVSKAARQLQLFSKGTLLRTYRVGLGLNPSPPKRRQGDRATPEGSFYVCLKNAHSQYYLSLGISYPGPSDAARGLRAGLITRAEHARILAASKARRAPPWNTALGGEVFIHGRGSSSDWTWGCVALDDTDMRELFDAIPLGTPVEIRP
jgi:murein L,D-transpeptidase YafK